MIFTLGYDRSLAISKSKEFADESSIYMFPKGGRFPLQIRQVLFIMSMFFAFTRYVNKCALYYLVYLFIGYKSPLVSCLIECDVPQH